MVKRKRFLLSPDSCLSNPCKHGGTCTPDGEFYYNCECQQNFSDDDCDVLYDSEFFRNQDQQQGTPPPTHQTMDSHTYVKVSLRPPKYWIFGNHQFRAKDQKRKLPPQ